MPQDLVVNDRRRFADLAVHYASGTSVIPAIPETFCTSWKQPPLSLYGISATHALMTLATFRELKEYSASSPSGTYPGKMWRRHNGAWDKQFLDQGGTAEWLLCWYAVSHSNPKWCMTETRKILLTDGDINAEV
jgi:hypothetical protein